MEYSVTTPTDLLLLLREYQALTIYQMCKLLNKESTRTNMLEKLQKLANQGLVTTQRLPRSEPVGSSPYIYSLTSQGYRALANYHDLAVLQKNSLFSCKIMNFWCLIYSAAWSYNLPTKNQTSLWEICSKLTITPNGLKLLKITRVRSICSWIQEAFIDHKEDADIFLCASVDPRTTPPLQLFCDPLFYQPFSSSLHLIIYLGALAT